MDVIRAADNVWLRSESDYSSMLHNQKGASEAGRWAEWGGEGATGLPDVGVQDGTYNTYMWQEEWCRVRGKEGVDAAEKCRFVLYPPLEGSPCPPPPCEALI